MKTIADNPTPAAPTDGQTGGGEDFPPVPDGRSTKALARRVDLFRMIATSDKPLRTVAVQSSFALEYGVTPRVIRDDLLILRANPAYRFWKVGRPGNIQEYVWTRRKRDGAAGSVIHAYGGDGGDAA